MKTQKELAEEFTPTTPRQSAMVKKCALLHPCGSEEGSCPCDGPIDCHIANAQFRLEGSLGDTDVWDENE
jgi:hypothetical protein